MDVLVIGRFVLDVYLRCAATPTWKESLRIALPFGSTDESQTDSTYEMLGFGGTEAPIEQVVKYHVRFMFRHRVTDATKDNQRPFALAYFRLQPKSASATTSSTLSTMVKDGDHELYVYKVPWLCCAILSCPVASASRFPERTRTVQHANSTTC